MYWFNLSQDRNQWQAFVNTVYFLTNRMIIGFWRRRTTQGLRSVQFICTERLEVFGLVLEIITKEGVLEMNTGKFIHNYKMHTSVLKLIFFLSLHRASWYHQRFHSPTDAHFNNLRKLKFTLKLILKSLLHVSTYDRHQGADTSAWLKLQLCWNNR
jgi:hypothetical protein